MPDAKAAVPTIGLTPKGRIRGILAALEDRWDSLTAEQQANALGLLSELSAAMRRREVERLKVG
jgi:hypothetical protein